MEDHTMFMYGGCLADTHSLLGCAPSAGQGQAGTRVTFATASRSRGARPSPVYKQHAYTTYFLPKEGKSTPTAGHRAQTKTKVATRKPNNQTLHRLTPFKKGGQGIPKRGQATIHYTYTSCTDM